MDTTPKFGFNSRVTVKNGSFYTLIPAMIADVYDLKSGDIVDISMKVVRRA